MKRNSAKKAAEPQPAIETQEVKIAVARGSIVPDVIRYLGRSYRIHSRQMETVGYVIDANGKRIPTHLSGIAVGHIQLMDEYTLQVEEIKLP